MIRNRSSRAEETQIGIFRPPPPRNSSAEAKPRPPRRYHHHPPLVNVNPSSINLNYVSDSPKPKTVVNWETETIRESKQREKPPPLLVLRWRGFVLECLFSLLSSGLRHVSHPTLFCSLLFSADSIKAPQVVIVEFKNQRFIT